MGTEIAAAAQTAWIEQRKGKFLLSTDPARLDLKAVHAFLSHYWETEGIPREVIERAVRRSLCFGVYDGAEQIGFARLVTDGATFAYLCDDYILEAYRGQGLGRWLMESIVSHPDLQGLRRWFLGPTHDARLYAKFGFQPIAEPGLYMEIVNAAIYKTR
jgi:GNAT superfamily N-acetyltransferase